jgi:hypothetical protein
MDVAAGLDGTLGKAVKVLLDGRGTETRKNLCPAGNKFLVMGTLIGDGCAPAT